MLKALGAQFMNLAMLIGISGVFCSWVGGVGNMMLIRFDHVLTRLCIHSKYVMREL